MLTCCFDDSGNIIEEEFNRIVKRFRNSIYAYANRYYLPGGDVDDLYQWGLLGLYKAVLHYVPNEKYSFEVTALINIKNMMKSAIRMANRNKHKAANTACSLYFSGDNGTDEFLDRLILDQRLDDPLAVILDRETVETMLRVIESYLTDRERSIIKLYICGYKPRHISEKLQCKPKTVDNAIQRVRRKLAKYFRSA
ncbi:sigma-70 family RNA polymerase sigma factor [Propionispora hippei]|uniref:RNA polymerase sporulation-specific sigma factor n=1 Tax=Propionispora hippei DSM 15287 TaxID=1123003 RepID=A0A1M6HIU9_9FIRM|nr:sigma-70 family RNA polymerase sigma factor [Propionispora hippei]SHJ22120.1 RNA polymerase sporulation-specific sigma factor [Propionispora hippei DSM 15287]